MSDWKAAHIMNEQVVTLSPEIEIYTAMHILLKHRISGAPVVEESGKLVGILSEKDCLKILTAEAFEGLPGGTVAHFMTRPVAVITPETSIYEIVDRFLKTPYRRLPVVDRESRLVGQVTRSDVLLAIEAMRDNTYLYGVESRNPPAEDVGGGVDSAMRRARGRI